MTAVAIFRLWKYIVVPLWESVIVPLWNWRQKSFNTKQKLALAGYLSWQVLLALSSFPCPTSASNEKLESVT